MKIIRHFIEGNCLRCFFSRLSILFLITFLPFAYSSKVSGQIAIPISELYSELKIYTIPDNPIASIFEISEDGNLFVGTNSGLLIIKENAEIIKVKNIEGEISEITVFGDKALIVSDKSCWLVNNSGEAVEIKEAKEAASLFESNVFKVIGEKGFFIKNNELWTIDREANVTKFINFKADFNNVEAFEEKMMIAASQGIWLLDKDKNLTKIEAGVIDYNEILILGEKAFINLLDSLWIVDKNAKANRVLEVNEVFQIKTFGEQIVALSEQNVWLVDKEAKAVKVEGIEDPNLNGIYVGKEKSIISSNNGNTWILGKDARAVKVDGIKANANFVNIKPFDDKFIVGATNGIWLVDNNAKAEKLIDAEVYGGEIAVFGEQAFICSQIGSWVINKDKTITKINVTKGYYKAIRLVSVGSFIYFTNGETFYRIDPKVTIKSKLIPANWWGKLIDSILPDNWVSSENVKAIADYSNEFDNDPYSSTIPKKFSFAKFHENIAPSSEEFSSQEQFTYPISLGKNSTHYWIKDQWGNTFEQKGVYYGVPSQYLLAILPFLLSAFLILGCFALAPKVGFAHSAIMNPWLRKYFSLGSVPLLVSVFPSLRRYILRRYADSIADDREFTEWKTRFVSPNEDFLPENFGKKLNDERKLLLTGQSGIGKTVFFKYLTACYVSENKPPFPAKVFPVYISLTNYGGNSLEDLVYNQLFAYGKITDKELAPMFLEQGGLLIFLDGVNEVQNVADRQKLSEFVEKYWTSNYICLSSQQSYPEIDNITKVELKTFSKEKVNEFIKQRANDKEKAEKVIANLTDEDYQLYSVPRDLEFAVAILNDGKDSLPKSRTQLYKTVFSSIFAKWQENLQLDAENTLCEHAYKMIAERDLAFDSVDNPKFKDITSDLFEQKFLIKREKNYNFRHDLIRSYLASEYFYPIWQNLFAQLEGKQIDSNWLEMLKFACENIENSNEVKSLVYSVMEKSIRKDLVKKLFEWLKTNHPNKCKTWEKEFYAKYGELDFK